MSAQPKTAEDLYRFLDELGIRHQTKHHAPVFTVAESVALRDEIPGGHTKNLFVKDKKDRFFLLTVEENAVVDLKTVHTLIGAASKVSFGKPEKLMEYLGVIPGSVTVFGALNDTGRAGFVMANSASDARASEQDIQAFVAEQVAHYKQVRVLNVVDEIPKSASGKILRRILRDQAAED